MSDIVFFHLPVFTVCNMELPVTVVRLVIACRKQIFSNST